MTRVMSWLALIGLVACVHGHFAITRKQPAERVQADSLYWSAVRNLDPSNRSGTLDSALTKLDAYLALPGEKEHEQEALVLRTLAKNSQQLARVQSALEQSRAADTKRAEPDSKGRDEEMVREIQRLKEELGKANDELERIKKRLAAPKP